MTALNMLLKSFIFEVDLYSIDAADIAEFVLILLYFSFFLPHFWKFIYQCAWENANQNPSSNDNCNDLVN